MTTITQSHSDLLRNALRANGVFSGLCGAILVAGAVQFVSLMGAGTPVIYAGVGAALLLHALSLFLYTRTETISRWFAWYAIAGDVAWVLATAAILLTGNIGFTDNGQWLLLIIADIVLVFAIVQFIGLRRQS